MIYGWLYDKIKNLIFIKFIVPIGRIKSSPLGDSYRL